MSQLHAYFISRNRQAFHRLLDSIDHGQLPGLSTSAGKSWNRSSSSFLHCDVNARDWLGRSVIHLACSSLDPSALDYIRLLLAHPAINVNIQDTESHWTPLHRALYHGHLEAALLLLQRPDTDTSLKDYEGHTAFDLYNSTLEFTRPLSDDKGRVELFTWGTNRNASLGSGDADDRTHPDQVFIPPKIDPLDLQNKSLDDRFLPIEARQVVMSRLHTVVLTSESVNNIRVCGFGNGGRLGPSQHTQYGLRPLAYFEHTIVSVALGQDHTLVLTEAGEVYSWGLNRFSQLGYVVEHASAVAGFARSEEPIQSTPKRVYGPLKKEIVRGIAASKSSSACWTDNELFTWGTNNGHLGYDKTSQPVQISPRKVTKVTQSIIDIAMTDSALACLLVSQEVRCIWNDLYFKIHFPSHAFPPDIKVFVAHPVGDAHVTKITSCDELFAALSSNGELFIFTMPDASETELSGSKERYGIKPHRVWALRKQSSTVKDVALGADGSIIACTESGHVFVRTRSSKGTASKTSKFQRVPYLQRVSSVCANSTGAFGALRVDFKPKAIAVVGTTLAQDLAMIQPYLYPPVTLGNSQLTPANSVLSDMSTVYGTTPSIELDDEDEDAPILRDINLIRRLLSIIQRNGQSPNDQIDHSSPDRSRTTHGADCVISLQSGSDFLAHRLMLAARVPILRDVFSGTKTVQDQDANISLELTDVKRSSTVHFFPQLECRGCHGFTILALLAYLYTDELPAFWDRRVAKALERDYSISNIEPNRVRFEMLTLARLLGLPLLAAALESPTRSMPNASLAHDLTHLLTTSQNSSVLDAVTAGTSASPLHADVILQLANRDLSCHSMILRSRSPFFADFFDDEDWTINRWNIDGTINIDMKHLNDRVMLFVLRFLYGDECLFDQLDSVESLDDVLEFVFKVMAAANELLLDRLVALCSTILLKYTNITNACYLLADATHYNSPLLVECLHGYMAANLETFLENHMLDDLSADLIKHLAEFIRMKQLDESPVSRSRRIIELAMQKHSEWLEQQDIPQPIVHPIRHGLHNKASPKLTPSSPGRKLHRQPSGLGSPLPSPLMCPQAPGRSPPSGDDIFVMDESDPLPALNWDQSKSSPVKKEAVISSVWKPSTAPRTDLKAIMAEAANDKTSGQLSVSPPLRPAIPSSRDTLLASQIKFISGPSQKDRRKQPGLLSENPADQEPINAKLSRPVTLPWRLPSFQGSQVETVPTAVGTIAHPPSTTRPRGSESNVSVVGLATRPSRLQMTPQSQRTQPALGPVITPTRQPIASGTSSTRSTPSGGKAWGLSPVQPIVDASPTAPGMSLVAIQQLQLEQGAAPEKGKRSLREIQEEEEARQAEADFLKWWSEEEERVKAEEEALSQFYEAHHNKPNQPKNQKGTNKRINIKGSTSQQAKAIPPSHNFTRSFRKGTP